MPNKKPVKTKLAIKSTHVLVVAGIFSLIIVLGALVWSKSLVSETNKIVTATEGLHQVGVNESSGADPLVTMVSQLPEVTSQDPVLGSPNAKVTIIDFSDYLCVHCGTVSDTLQDLIKIYPEEVRLVAKDAPVDLGESYWAALAGRCAQSQGKFWEMHNLLFNNQVSLSRELYSALAKQLGLDLAAFDDCLDNQETAVNVDQTITQAEELGITEVPYYFINDLEFVGLGTLADFQVVVDYLLNEDKNQGL